MINAAPSVIIISGRTALSEEFARRCDPKPVQFVSIPVEAGGHTQAERPHHHFPEVYEHILSSMHGDHTGMLVLVGAGIFGKAYCQAAKRAGAVALDLGSAFDILAGLKTRPMHDNSNLVNFDAMRWL
jgi:NAD(P)H-dependent flavin oxidoreductase YrpB (nitropropane dioxygenase family)